MEYKGILKIFLITILMMAVLNCAYADAGPFIGENQAKKIANGYLNYHNVPYKVTTATDMVKIKNKKTGVTKWVTWPKWFNMTNEYYKTTGDPYIIEHFEWKRAGIYEINKTVYDSAWKIAIVDNQGEKVGNIWVNDIIGEVMEVDLKPVNNTNSNQTTNAINTTNQTSHEPNNQSGSLANTWILLATAGIAIVLGAGYWKFNRR